MFSINLPFQLKFVDNFYIQCDMLELIAKPYIKYVPGKKRRSHASKAV